MATIDASIPLGVRPVQIADQMNALAKVMQLKGMQQEQSLGKMKMDEYTRGIEDQNVLRSELSKPGADTYNVLLGRGKVKEAMDWRKGEADAKKTAVDTTKAEADIRKIDFDTEVKKIEHISSVLSTARDPASYEAARQIIGRQFPQALANLPPQFDPAALQGLIAQGQTITQRLNDERQRQTIAETGRHNAATEGLTLRGQDMVDKRSRETNAAAMSKPFEVTGEDGKPVLVQQDKQGNIHPVTGYLPKTGSKDGGTVDERNAAGYASRMSAAEKIIGTVGAAAPGAQKPGLIEQATGGVGMLANASRSSDRQQYRQAQEDWVRAKLRKESGAVIGDDEMAREIAVYFPQIGDQPKVVAQKADARKVAEQAMIQSGGRAVKPPAANAPKAGTVQDGYRFKGGDPADQKSWEKI